MGKRLGGGLDGVGYIPVSTYIVLIAPYRTLGNLNAMDYIVPDLFVAPISIVWLRLENTV